LKDGEGSKKKKSICGGRRGNGGFELEKKAVGSPVVCGALWNPYRGNYMAWTKNAIAEVTPNKKQRWRGVLKKPKKEIRGTVKGSFGGDMGGSAWAKKKDIACLRVV